jgi:hypothetical protein
LLTGVDLGASYLGCGLTIQAKGQLPPTVSDDEVFYETLLFASFFPFRLKTCRISLDFLHLFL